MSVAVGTSLLVISMKSFAGLAGYLASVHIDWGLAALVTATAVVGGLLGGRLAGRIPQDALRKSFGWFVAAMGVFVLGQQIAPGLRHALLTSAWTWASVAATAVVLISWWMLRRAAGTPVREDRTRTPADSKGPPVLGPAHKDLVRSRGTAVSRGDTQ